MYDADPCHDEQGSSQGSYGGQRQHISDMQPYLLEELPLPWEVGIRCSIVRVKVHLAESAWHAYTLRRLSIPPVTGAELVVPDTDISSRRPVGVKSFRWTRHKQMQLS